jgi:hypothetical protein
MLKFVMPAAALALVACAGSADPPQQSALSDVKQRALQGRVVGEPVSCLSSREIYDTDGITDRVVLFHLRNGRTYRNDLPSACPQIAREGTAFVSQTTITRLCALDIVQLYEPSSGFVYGGCALGKFVPYELPEGVNRASL